jgi:hypothetical protein
LDIEYGDLSIAPSVSQDEAYILAWCQTVSAHGYVPGVYCPYSDGATIFQLLQQSGINAPIWVANPNYGVSPGLYNLPTPNPSNSGCPDATSWQYADGYTILTINGPYSMDLDSSSYYETSSQQVPPVLASSTVSNGQLQTTVSGLVPGEMVVLQVSTDLQHWAAIQTNTATDVSIPIAAAINPSVKNQYFRTLVQ